MAGLLLVALAVGACMGQDPVIDQVPIGALLPGEWPQVACGMGALLLEVVQPAGRPAMPADAWRRGLPRDHVLLGAAPPPDAER